MIENSSALVYSFLQNLKKYMDGKDCRLLEENAFGYARTVAFVKDHCRRIYNELENHWYSYDDIALFYLYRMLFNKKTYHADIIRHDISKMKLLFGKKQLKHDKKFLVDVGMQSEIKHFDEYFELDNGEPIIFHLILEKTVSPIIFCWAWKNYVRPRRDEYASNGSDRFREFCYINKKLIHVLTNGVMNG